jgi:AraC-like DNA-binding protein
VLAYATRPAVDDGTSRRCTACGTELRPGATPNDVGQRTTGTVTAAAAFAAADAGNPATQHAVMIAASQLTRTFIRAPSLCPKRAIGFQQVSAVIEERNRRMLRARDAMDRDFARPLDVAAVAAVAHVSPAHFSRQFHATFGETPHAYLRRRRVERAMELLRETDRSVTEICFDVGFASLGTFSRTFREIVGESPSQYRARFASGGPGLRIPACWAMTWLRPAG